MLRDRVTIIAASVALVVSLVVLVERAHGATGAASAYGPGLYGQRMACGGTLTPATRAIAHRWFPCGARVRICYAGRCATASVRDRGPYVAGRDLDLTEGLVRALGHRSALAWGVRVVTWRRVR